MKKTIIAHWVADNGDEFDEYDPGCECAGVETKKCYARIGRMAIPHLSYYKDPEYTEFIGTAGIHVTDHYSALPVNSFVYTKRKSADQPFDSLTKKLYSPTTNLAEVRLEARMSQADLAEKSGISVKTIQNYECRKRDINKARSAIVLRLARALGCAPENILEPSEETLDLFREEEE